MKTILIYCLNLYFYTVYIAYTLLFVPAATVIMTPFILFRSKRYKLNRLRRVISWYGRGTMAIPFPFIRLAYEKPGNDNTEEPFIYICNHRSASDPFLMCVLPNEAIQIVNIWPFNIPILGFFARMAGYINIRKIEPEEFFERGTHFLEEKVSIIFFPEGTRSTNMEMGNFHGAAFRLALKSKYPIVPLCISGSEKIPPKGSLMLRPGKIRVRRLPAITWDEYKDLNAFTLKKRVRDMIDRELKVMEKRA